MQTCNSQNMLAYLIALGLLFACGYSSPLASSILPVPDAAFKFWDMPTSNSGPCDVATGPDNYIYIQEFFANKIVRFNQRTETFTEYDIPFTVPGIPNATLPLGGDEKAFLLSCAIRTGYDGYMYFSNGAHNQLVRHDVWTGEVVVFTPPGLGQVTGNLQPLNDLTTAPDGVYFSQTTGNVITRFDYKTHDFTTFLIPTPLAVPVGMYHAKDDGIWFLELAGNKVGRFDRKTHQFKEFPLPAGAMQPVVMRAETSNSDGSTTLWFACASSSSIVGINTKTKKFLVYPEPNGPTLTVEVAQDTNNNIWATHILQNSLGVLNPRSGRVNTVLDPGTLNLPVASLPVTGGSGIIGKSVGIPPGRGSETAAGNNIYYTRFLANKLVKLDLSQVKVP